MLEKESKGYKSFYKIDYKDTHTRYYRLALLYIAILFPITGIILKFISKETIDPIWMRFIISWILFLVYFLSFKIKLILKDFVSNVLLSDKNPESVFLKQVQKIKLIQ